MRYVRMQMRQRVMSQTGKIWLSKTPAPARIDHMPEERKFEVFHHHNKVFRETTSGSIRTDQK